MDSKKNKLVYIDFIDCKKNYKKNRKDFKTYEEAKNFIIKTFDRIDFDIINYY